MPTDNKFGEWLNIELKQKGWILADLAKKAQISSGGLSHVVNGGRNPGPEMCRGIAKALGYTEEYVFRKAGLLSPEQPVTKEEIEKLNLRELIDLFEKMTPDQREDVIEYAIWRWEQSKKRKNRRRASSATNPAAGAT